MNKVWDVATELKDGDNVRVKYDSRRGDGIKTMEGRVVKVEARDDCEIKFRRSDGQKCVVSSDGTLKSLGSHFPITGDVIDICATDPEVLVP